LAGVQEQGWPLLGPLALAEPAPARARHQGARPLTKSDAAKALLYPSPDHGLNFGRDRLVTVCAGAVALLVAVIEPSEFEVTTKVTVAI